MNLKALQASDFMKMDNAILRVQYFDFFEKKYGFLSEFVEYFASDPVSVYVGFVVVFFLLLCLWGIFFDS